MKKMIFIAGLLLVSVLVHGQTSHYCEKGVAIKGYDAVAYFTQNSAVKGNDALAYQWDNAKWLFSSQSHLDLFRANPEKYAPQYGGWCAYGLSDNYKAPTDPKAFTIVDDKLYLNYNPKVMELWRQDTTRRINLADKHWPALKHAQ